MSDSSRSVQLVRLAKARFRATNRNGDTMVVGEGADTGTFTPVELLLVAIGACGAIDVDYITAKRAEAAAFSVTVQADKVRDEGGNHLTDLRVVFDVRFDDTDAGRAALDVLPRAVAQSNDRLCTVSRTVQLGEPVQALLASEA
jgi:putative redox protein